MCLLKFVSVGVVHRHIAWGKTESRLHTERRGEEQCVRHFFLYFVKLNTVSRLCFLHDSIQQRPSISKTYVILTSKEVDEVHGGSKGKQEVWGRGAVFFVFVNTTLFFSLTDCNKQTTMPLPTLSTAY